MTEHTRRRVRLARPFAVTGGRTRTDAPLNIEDLVVTTHDGAQRMDRLHDERQAIASLCLRPRSVAEIAAVVDLPLGVARVVIGDLVCDGLARIYTTEVGDRGPGPDAAPVLERLIDGLRAL